MNNIRKQHSNYPKTIHIYFTSTFNQVLDAQIIKESQKLKNEMKRRMSDNETTPKFMWKTFEEVKNHRPTTDKKIHYEKQSRCISIYRTQDLQSLMDYLTSAFSDHHYAFIFRNMLGVIPKLDLNFLLETPSRRKWVFT